MLARLPHPAAVATTIPSTSPMAHPVRQCRVAVTASRQELSPPPRVPRRSRRLIPEDSTPAPQVEAPGPVARDLGGVTILLSDPRVSAVPLVDNREPLVALDASFGPARALVRQG